MLLILNKFWGMIYCKILYKSKPYFPIAKVVIGFDLYCHHISKTCYHFCKSYVFQVFRGKDNYYSKGENIWLPWILWIIRYGGSYKYIYIYSTNLKYGDFENVFIM